MPRRIERPLSSRVTPTARSMNCQFTISGEMSMSMVGRREFDSLSPLWEREGPAPEAREGEGFVPLRGASFIGPLTPTLSHKGGGGFYPFLEPCSAPHDAG